MDLCSQKFQAPIFPALPSEKKSSQLQFKKSQGTILIGLVWVTCPFPGLTSTVHGEDVSLPPNHVRVRGAKFSKWKRAISRRRKECWMHRVTHTHNRRLRKYLYFIHIHHLCGCPQFESRLCSPSFHVWLRMLTKGPRSYCTVAWLGNIQQGQSSQVPNKEQIPQLADKQL